MRRENYPAILPVAVVVPGAAPQFKPLLGFDMDRLWEFIRQHKLYRLAVGYAMAAWLFAQAASIVLPAFDAPAWGIRLVIVLSILGLPTTLASGWLLTSRGSAYGRYGTYGILGLLGLVILLSGAELLWQWPVALPSGRTNGRPDAASEVASAAQTGRVEIVRFEVRQPDPLLQGFAADLADSLVRNLSRSAIDTVPQVTERGASSSQANVELRVTGAVEREGDDVVANVQVLDVGSDLVLNSAQIRRPASALPGFADGIGLAMASALDCAIEDRRQSRQRIEPAVFALYLNTCDAFLREHNVQRALETARRLVKAAPHLAIAQALYAVMLTQAAGDGERPPAESAALLLEARRTATLALKLDPLTPKAYIALSLSYPNGSHWLERIQNLQKAWEVDPNFGPGRLAYLTLLREAGHRKLSLQLAEQLRDSPDPRIAGGAEFPLAYSLAQSGDIDGAKNIARRLQRYDPASARLLRWEIISSWEDPAAALKDLRALDTEDIDPHSLACERKFLAERTARIASHARGLPTACDEAPTIRRILLLIHEHDIDGAYAEGARAADLDTSFLNYLYGPDTRAFWSDPRFMSFAQRFGLTDYWVTSNHWPDFCADPALPYDCRKVARAALLSLAGKSHPLQAHR